MGGAGMSGAGMGGAGGGGTDEGIGRPSCITVAELTDFCRARTIAALPSDLQATDGGFGAECQRAAAGNRIDLDFTINRAGPAPQVCFSSPRWEVTVGRFDGERCLGDLSLRRGSPADPMGVESAEVQILLGPYPGAFQRYQWGDGRACAAEGGLSIDASPVDWLARTCAPRPAATCWNAGDWRVDGSALGPTCRADLLESFLPRPLQLAVDGDLACATVLAGAPPTLTIDSACNAEITWQHTHPYTDPILGRTTLSLAFSSPTAATGRTSVAITSPDYFACTSEGAVTASLNGYSQITR